MRARFAMSLFTSERHFAHYICIEFSFVVFFFSFDFIHFYCAIFKVFLFEYFVISFAMAFQRICLVHDSWIWGEK